MAPNELSTFLWITASAGLFLLASAYSVTIENQYRLEFNLRRIGYPKTLPSQVLALVILVALCWQSKNRLPEQAFLCFTLAAASLLATWRIDRLVLLIPDRLQLMGLFAGVSYLAILIASGENWKDLALELLYGEIMVAALWFMSFLYLKLRNTVGFGMGDIKLLGWLAFFVSKNMPNLILLSIAMGFLGLLITLVRQSIRERKLKLPGAQDAFAFGPSIVAAACIQGFINYD